MTKKLDLMGQQFGKLTVKNQAPNIMGNNGKRLGETAWECQCECGNSKIIKTSKLQRGATSCGCDFNLHGLSLMPNQKINRLTTVSYQGDSKWLCKCECGETIIIKTCHLNSGNTKSCGCLKSEKAQINIQEAIKKTTLYTPSITTARRRWKSYCYQDKQCDLTFERWYDISQQNCFYCGIGPSTTYNAFLKKKDASQTTKDNGYFTYNGLDRIDNSKPHIIDNVVACCPTCNRAKGQKSMAEFFRYIHTIKSNNVFIAPQQLLTLPEGYLLVSVKVSYHHYKRNYGTMEIDVQTLYTLSQLPCFYCGMEKSNYFNVYLKDKKASQTAKDGAHFHYNGIDRLDNIKGHTIDNVVPCCYHCNFAKGKLSLSEFQAWIKRIQQFQCTK